MEPFPLLQEILAGEISCMKELRESGGVYDRLGQVLSVPARAGFADVAVLLRQVLRMESLQRSNSQELIIKYFPWEITEKWETFGLESNSMGKGLFSLKAQDWNPIWLGEGSEQIERSLYLDEVRNANTFVEADPFLRHFGFGSYKSETQREAFRNALTCPPGASLLLILPTGSGKSLCAYGPALFHERRDEFSLVISPTTALSLDQERNLLERGLVNHPVAYLGGRPENRGILERIRNGEQRLVFSSPEAVVQSLASPLLEVARKGNFGFFVLDEAHMVDQWGDTFRPEFQELAGLRTELMEISPKKFPTILLSATVTRKSLQTLQTFFGKPGPFKVFNGQSLRPEPQYWFSYCGGFTEGNQKQEKQKRVQEILRNIPRPAILYTTLVEEAEEWTATLHKQGFKRIGLVTGKTSTQERERVLQEWRKNEIDLVVATSAFGLGMDKEDVRTVIHACLPEGLDRYYQEVGRAGRDGKTSLSLLVYTDEDLEIAERMSRSKGLGAKRAFQRWSRMFASSTQIGDTHRFVVPYDVSPGFEPEDIDMCSQANERWNLNTLNLMARSGLLELRGAIKPEEKRKKTRVVEIKEGRHLEQRYFEERTRENRRFSYRERRNSFLRMKEMLQGQKCVSVYFKEEYTLEENPNLPSRSCNGCEYCRKNKIEPFSGVSPFPLPLWKNGELVVDLDESWYQGLSNPVGVFYPTDGNGKSSELQILEEAIRLILSGKALWNCIYSYFFSKIVDRLSANYNTSFFIKYELENLNPLTLFPIPTIILLDKFSQPKKAWLERDEKAKKILFLPEAMAALDKPQLKLKDVFPTQPLTLVEFARRLGL